MPYRFVHTADLHLDSPLRSLAMRDAALRDRVDLATREAFERLVSAALEERVDALMIAGDLFDGTQTSQKSSLFLSAQFARLAEAGIRVFVVKGNHDAKAAVTRGLDLPRNVTLFDGRGGASGAATARPDGVPVIVHGVSFRDAKASDSLLPKYARPTEGAIDIGLMHTSLAGAAGHDVYAPCALSDLVGHGFSYWGLGHVHSRAVHHDGGDCAVVMPGMPQGRDVGEAGAKSASLVTIHDDGSVTLDTIPTSVAVFARERVALAGGDWDDALATAEAAIIDAVAREAASEGLVVRLDLSGESAEHWRLRRDADEFTSMLTDRLGEGVHIEKVGIDVRPPRAVRDDGRDEGPLRELVAGMGAEIARPDFRADALDLMEEIARSLPKAARDRTFGADTAERDAILDALLADGVAEMAARIEGGAANDGGAV